MLCQRDATNHTRLVSTLTLSKSKAFALQGCGVAGSRLSAGGSGHDDMSALKLGFDMCGCRVNPHRPYTPGDVCQPASGDTGHGRHSFGRAELSGLRASFAPHTTVIDGFAKPRLALAEIRAEVFKMQPVHSPFVLLPRYLSPDAADAIGREVMRLRHRRCTTDMGPRNGDMRTYASERYAERPGALVEFNEDAALASAAVAHLRWDTPEGSRQRAAGMCETMLGRIDARVNHTASSAGGWHKDKTHAPGFKALLYVEDVRGDNGPFSMLLNYNNTRLRRCSTMGNAAPQFYAEADIGEELERGASIVEFHAPKGSVVLFETSSIHRGQVGSPPHASLERPLFALQGP